MCLDLLADARFFSLLLAFDRNLGARTRAAGCPCGGPLYVADFARKPRGARGLLPAGFERRLSFCCGRDGCRRRATPPSVRFLGRKVYLAATVVLVTALRHGRRLEAGKVIRHLNHGTKIPSCSHTRPPPSWGSYRALAS